MRALKFIALAPLLAIGLAGCDDSETAQRTAVTTTTEAAPPAAATTAPPPPRTAEGANAAPPATMTMPPANATTPRERPPETTGTVGSQGAAVIRDYAGRPYTSGTVSMRLDPDGSFEMREEQGTRRIAGQYALAGDVVTFEPVTGDVAWTQAPMRCRFMAAGDGFALQDVQDACAPLAGQTFRPAP